jgi:TPR repeat protein
MTFRPVSLTRCIASLAAAAALGAAIAAEPTPSNAFDKPAALIPFTDFRVVALDCTPSTGTGLHAAALLPEASAGNPNSMVLMGYYYEAHGDKVSARHWFEAAASTRYPRAFSNLAALHFCGRIYPQDYTRAVSYFEQAFALGDKSAGRELGNLYELGAGVSRDGSKALYWYEKSDSIDYPRALFQGVGTRPDPQRAFQVLKAMVASDAKRNIATEAQFQLALMYLTGMGTSQSEPDAKALLRKLTAAPCCVDERTRSRAKALMQLGRGPVL